jgi:hypothetical protein
VILKAEGHVYHKELLVFETKKSHITQKGGGGSENSKKVSST